MRAHISNPHLHRARSQTIERVPHSIIARRGEVLPTITPGARLWNYQRGRLLTGWEKLLLQGIPWGAMPCPEAVTEAQAADLAGNAFAGTIACALSMAVFAALVPPCEEDEEAVATATLFLSCMGAANSG